MAGWFNDAKHQAIYVRGGRSYSQPHCYSSGCSMHNCLVGLAQIELLQWLVVKQAAMRARACHCLLLKLCKPSLQMLWCNVHLIVRYDSYGHWGTVIASNQSFLKLKVEYCFLCAEDCRGGWTQPNMCLCGYHGIQHRTCGTELCHIMTVPKSKWQWLPVTTWLPPLIPIVGAVNCTTTATKSLMVIGMDCLFGLSSYCM